MEYQFLVLLEQNPHRQLTVSQLKKKPQSKLVITETEDTVEGHLYVFYDSLSLSLSKKTLFKARRKRIIKNHKEIPLIKLQHLGAYQRGEKYLYQTWTKDRALEG